MEDRPIYEYWLDDQPMRTCPICDGSGDVEFGAMLSPQMVECRHCMGDGYVIDDEVDLFAGEFQD